MVRASSQSTPNRSARRTSTGSDLFSSSTNDKRSGPGARRCARCLAACRTPPRADRAQIAGIYRPGVLPFRTRHRGRRRRHWHQSVRPAGRRGQQGQDTRTDGGIQEDGRAAGRNARNRVGEFSRKAHATKQGCPFPKRSPGPRSRSMRDLLPLEHSFHLKRLIFRRFSGAPR
jgi:hypothetical protein